MNFMHNKNIMSKDLWKPKEKSRYFLLGKLGKMLLERRHLICSKDEQFTKYTKTNRHN